MSKVPLRRTWIHRVGVGAVTLTVGTAMLSSSAAGEEPAIKPTDYVGSVEVVRDSSAEPPKTVRGVVFDDVDRDSRHGDRERGVAGVAVSNGREVVRTDRDGRYELPVYDGMTVFVTKPTGYLTPVDSDGFPQFFYHHLPEGSPDLRFDGLPPTGPLPKAINFPLLGSPERGEMDCAVIGDTQTYSNREVGYLRDGVVADLAARDDLDACGALIVGDVVGDDLGLYPHLKQAMGLSDVPVRAVPGNHDIDFDAAGDENSFDTYRREIGPSYYSYNVGDVHFVGLDNVRYPCTPDADNADGKHSFCNDPANHPRYNGVIGGAQLKWLANDLATVPKDKLVVIATHIPLVGFQDMNSTQHQTDDVGKLYELLKDRPALSVSGHTQALENLDKGDSYAGWKPNVGVNVVPFQHIVVGAASGSWWTGDLGVDGLPETLQRDGSPPGYLNLEVTGNRYVDTYRATGRPEDEQMSLSLNSPMFREWYGKLDEWNKQNPDGSATPPPVNINDLGDPNLLTKAELADGSSWLVANFWNGTSSAKVTVQIDDRKPVAATRTQQARGEGQRAGAEYGDPAALMRQLQVARYGLASTSGDERAQGWEVFRGTKFGPGPAQPESRWLWSDRSNHLWRLPLPADLAVGGHTATVRATDEDGREFVGRQLFEVADKRPPMQFRKEQFAQPTG